MLGERQHPVADRVSRRLVPGRDEEQEERTQLARREPVFAVLVFDLGVHERSGDVVAGIGQAVFGDREPVLEQLHARAHELFYRRHVLGVADAEDRVGQLEDALVVLAGDAHHVADDLER